MALNFFDKLYILPPIEDLFFSLIPNSKYPTFKNK
jgi:hypothetical protein